TGSHPHAVLPEHLQAHQAFGSHRCNVGDHLILEPFLMGGAEVGQRVVTDIYPTPKPLERIAIIAPARQFAGAADAFVRGVQPQGHEDLRIDGGSSSMAFHCFYPRVEGSQVQLSSQLPNRTRLMVWRDQIVNLFRIGINLRAIRQHYSGQRFRASILWIHGDYRSSREKGVRSRKTPQYVRFQQTLKYRFLHTLSVSSAALPWVSKSRNQYRVSFASFFEIRIRNRKSFLLRASLVSM